MPSYYAIHWNAFCDFYSPPQALHKSNSLDEDEGYESSSFQSSELLLHNCVDSDLELSVEAKQFFVSALIQ
jgi:hypothetical protein